MEGLFLRIEEHGSDNIPIKVVGVLVLELEILEDADELLLDLLGESVFKRPESTLDLAIRSDDIIPFAYVKDSQGHDALSMLEFFLDLSYLDMEIYSDLDWVNSNLGFAS